MVRYAKGTSVSEEKSKAEIEAMVRRYGAGKLVTGWTGDAAVVAFEANGRLVRFTLPLPAKNEERFWYSRGDAKRGRWRAPSQRGQATAERAWRQEVRERWRALALVIKAKLEAVTSGISTFEMEFLAWTVVPGTADGETFGEWAVPRLAEAYAQKRMPPLLAAKGVRS